MRIPDFLPSGLRAILGLLVIAAASPAADPPPRDAIDFNRHIRPILSENCFACHGPDAKARKAKLRFDVKDVALSPKASGRRIIAPGKPAESELIARITASDASEVMPPVKSGKRLTPQQIELFRRWIEQGATWSEHWAFVAPQRPTPPGVKDTAWVRNPIDAFILARLETEGLKPSPEVDRAALIRRVSLDLTGLPTTLKEVDDFLADASPNAYEKVVDRLLRSPRYGERMAMQWLDGARYADSNGFQADFERYMWRWRDWVIDAFNANKRFDQFTIEQLAGDLLPNAVTEQKVATGFNRNHRINTEGGIIAEEWRIESVADRLETTAAVWLGLTIGCARCHDHKYDPIAQKEYYQLFAFFNNVPESGIGAEQPVNHPPLIRTPRPSDLQRLQELDAAVARLAGEVGKDREKRLSELQAEWEKTAAQAKPGVAWTILTPSDATSAGKAKMTVLKDGTVVAAGPNPKSDTYTLAAAVDVKELSAIRLETLPDETLTGKGPGRSVNGNIVLTDVRLQIDGKDVKLASASADFSQQEYPVTAAIDGDPRTGWAVYPQVGVPHAAVFGLEKPAALKPGTKLTVKLAFESQWDHHQLGRFRLSVTDAKSPHQEGGIPPAILAILNTLLEKRTAQQQKELTDYFRAHHAGAVTQAEQRLQAARQARTEYEKSLPTVMVMEEMPQPRDCFVLIRGQYDKRGDKVTAGLPSVLPPMPAGTPMNRLGLAKWLVDPAHPLTARVAVNRLWEKFFGVGVVKSTENFGAQGEPPSHPELLDWLATEYVRIGWDTKAIQKTIVMSAAYRQSSAVTKELLEKDPENRLIVRGARFRLPAEAVRDNALAICGLLVDRVGGPSVRPYMPDGFWDETQVYGNLRNYKHDKGEGLYRRSMYTIWKRTSAPPTMLLFDTPSREVCAVKRPRTNTPLQALVLLNETAFVEASRALAERMMRDGGSTVEEQITYAFRRAVARKPTETEMGVLASGLKLRVERLRKDPKAAEKLLAVGDYRHDPRLDSIELAARTVTASVILNLDETITRE